MATTTVQLVVKTVGQGQVERLNQTLGRTNNIAKQVGQTLAGLALGSKLKQAFGDAEQLQRVEKGLVRIQKQYRQFAGIEKEATRLSKKFEISLTQSGTALTSLGSRLGAQGATLKDITTVYEGVSSALIATNRSASEAEATMYQLSQALGSGSLTGDELKTISEALPELLNEIAVASGRSAKEIRQMAKDGLLTTDVIIKASAALRDKYKDAVADNITPTQKLNNALGSLSETVGKRLAPVLTPFIEKLSDLVNLFGELPEPVQTALAGVALFTAAALALGPIVSVLFGLLGKLGLGLIGLGLGGGASQVAIAGLSGTTKAMVALKGAALLLKPALIALPFAALAGVIMENVIAKRKFDEVMRSGSVEELTGKIEELIKKKEDLERRLKALKNGQYYKGMQSDINQLQSQIDIMGEKIDHATRRRQLVIEIVEKKHTIGGIDYQSTRTGRLVPVGNVPETVSQRKEREAEEERARQEALKALQGAGTKDAVKAAKGASDSITDHSASNADELKRQEIANAQEVFRVEMALEDQKYQLKKQYQEKLNKLAAMQLSPRARGPFNTLLGISKDKQMLDEMVRDLEKQIKQAKMDLQSAIASPVGMMMGGGSSGGRYIEGGYGPSGPNHYGAHFDIKKMTGDAYYDRSALDRYVRVNGMPLSSGVTVPGGEFGAPRSYGPHAGWDYAFGGGAALTLTGGAKFVSSNRTAYGDATAFQTPDGNVYKIIHGTFEPGPPGDGNVTMDQTGAISRQGGIDQAKTRLEGLEAQRDALTGSLDQMSGADFKLRMLEFTDAYKQQTQQIKEQTEALQLRSRLEMEGVRPELIDAEIKKLETSRLLTAQTEALDAALKEGIISQEQYNTLLGEASTLSGQAAAAFDEQAAAMVKVNDAAKLQGQIKQLASGISSEFTKAFKDVITGTKSVEQAFSDMLTNIGNMFLDMAMKILQDALTQQLVGLFGGLLGGGFGGGGGGGFSMPIGNIGVGGFADGGYVTRPQLAQIGEGGQPEYVIPASEMGKAMARYSSGARGSSVINGPDPMMDSSSEAAMTAKESSPVNITYTGPTLNFNGDDYIPRSEAPKLVAEGAKMGEARTLGRLRGSAATRKKVGL